MNYKTFCAIALVVFVMSCSKKERDPRVLDNENARIALNAYFEKSPVCIRTSEKKFPSRVSASKKSVTSVLDAFVDAGLLVKSETEEFREKATLPRFGKKKAPEMIAVKVFDYQLTDAGHKHLITKKNPMLGELAYFCYGSWEAQSISKLTEPAEFLGKKVATVKYVRQVRNPAMWTSRYKGSLKGLEAEEHKTRLILTKNGWVHKNEI